MKRILLLSAFSIFGLAAFAQSGVKFGVKAGVINSDIKGDAVNSLNSILDYTQGLVKPASKTSFYGGFTAELPIATDLFFEPGIIYSEKGYEMNGEFNLKDLEFIGANAKARLQLNYVDIPVLLKYKSSGLSISVGPQFSYLTKGNLNTRAGLLGINLLNKDIDVSNNFNKWDVGISGGVGYDITPNIGINAAYDHGLTKIDVNRNTNAYNTAIRVGLNFKF